MAEIQTPRKTLLLLAAFSRREDALQWARRTAESHWGPIALASDIFRFDDTTYYQSTMGDDLGKVFFAFDTLIDPAELVAIKRRTNELEDEFRSSSAHAERRPLNLDPGYVTEAKLVLATTKDRDHRIYLGEGIYAEVTLHFRQGTWQPWPWTYPDYARQAYHEFFAACRDYLRQRYRDEASGENPSEPPRL